MGVTINLSIKSLKLDFNMLQKKICAFQLGEMIWVLQLLKWLCNQNGSCKTQDKNFAKLNHQTQVEKDTICCNNSLMLNHT